MFRKLFIILCVSFANVAWGADQEYCLAEAIYFEARSQSLIGQRAVGLVIMNRVRHHTFPSTPCEVTRQAKYNNYQPVLNQCHFSFYCDGKPEHIHNHKSWRIAKQIAVMLLYNEVYDFTRGALYYHALYIRKPYWASSMKTIIIIDEHIFYGED